MGYVDLAGEGIYKGHRIHATQLPISGAWVALAYQFGATDSGVRPIRGEYPTRIDAVAAAKENIDREEAGRS